MSLNTVHRLVIGLILSMVVALSCGFTHAYAADGGIQVDGTGSYDVYRLLSGTSHSYAYDDMSFPASAWGECGISTANPGLTQDELATKLKESPDKTTLTIAKAARKSGTPLDTIAGGSTMPLTDGYYIVLGDDIVPSLIPVEGSVVKMTPKGGAPTVEKEVLSCGSTYDKRALTETSESKPYRLTGSLPPNYDSYETYWYKFTDVMKPSLKLDNSAPVVVRAVMGTTSTDISDKASITYEDGTLTVSFEDLKQAVPEYGDGAEVLVEYGAKLASGAYETGGAHPQVNTAYLEYTSYMAPEGIGKTVETKTESYTFALNIRKVDNVNKETLAGAEFVMKDSDGLFRTVSGQWSEKEADAFIYKTDGSGVVSITGLSAGRYFLLETKAPEGYVKPDKPIEVTIDASLDEKVHLSASTIDSGIAEITAVSAADGTVDMVVENPKQKEELPPANETTTPTPPNDTSQKTSTSILDNVPKLGEHPIAVTIIAVIAAAVVVIAVRNRKNRSKEEDGGSQIKED